MNDEDNRRRGKEKNDLFALRYGNRNREASGLAVPLPSPLRRTSLVPVERAADLKLLDDLLGKNLWDGAHTDLRSDEVEAFAGMRCDGFAREVEVAR